MVSPSAWEVLERQDEPEMSQPCQYHRHQGCGDPQDPGVGAGDCSLCHTMPARASVPGSLLLMLSLPTIHPFPQIPCSQPIKTAFCSTKTHLGPQEGLQGATTPRAPHNRGAGGSFLPSPTSAEGQGGSSVSFPAVGFLSGELRAGFAVPKLQGLGVEAARGRESSLLPHRPVTGWGKGHQLGTGGAEAPSWPKPEGWETEFGFFPAFSRCFYSTQSRQKKSRMRDCGV